MRGPPPGPLPAYWTSPVPVILPAKYLRKLVPQAMEKQEELKSGGGEEAEAEEEKEAAPAEGDATEGDADPGSGQESADGTE